MISLMAKLTLAITLADPIDDKKCNSVRISWIHENNDRVSRSWIVTKLTSRKYSEAPGFLKAKSSAAEKCGGIFRRIRSSL